MVWLLVAFACAGLLAWWLTPPDPAPGWATAVALSGCTAALACSAGFWHLQPSVLRWDRQHWLHSGDGSAEQAGEIAVAVDLGSWMLLSFVPQGAPGVFGPGRNRRWIAVQRRGLETQWHALRCAVYSHRLAAPDGP